MVNRIDLVQNDTAKPIELTLVDNSTGLPLNLSVVGTVLVMNVSLLGGVAPVASITVTAGPIAAQGQCTFTCPSPMMAVAGYYTGEVQITWPNGDIQTTPSKLKLYIRPQIG